MGGDDVGAGGAGDVAAAPDDAESDVVQRVETARDAFLGAWNSYDAAGRQLEKQVIEQLAPYHDGSHDRARIIQTFARDLSHQLGSFETIRWSEQSQIVNLSVSFNHTMDRLMIEGFRASSEMLIEHVKEWSKSLAKFGTDESASEDAARRRMAELLDVAKRVTEDMAWAFEIGTRLVDLRQHDLGAYLKKVPLVDQTSAIRKALAVAIAKEAALAAVELGGNVIALGVPIGTIVAGIVSIGDTVREKVRNMNAHYERGALDEMFELAQAIDDEQQIHVALAQMLDMVDHFFSSVRAHYSGAGLR